MVEKKTVTVLAFAIILLLLGLTVYALNTGALIVRGQSLFTEDVQIIGTLTGSSNMRIAEGIDYLDLNGQTDYSTYIKLSEEAVIRNVPDDFNTVFIFESSIVSAPFSIDWVFWNAITERPTFVLEHGFVGRSNVLERSLQIGKDLGDANLTLDYTICSGFSLIDCDTPGTGADLGVEDDIEAFGSIQSHENLIVDGNSTVTLFYGSMFQEDNGNTVVLSDTSNFFLIDGMELGLSNGFVFDNNSHLQALQPGVYLVNWSLSFSDLAARSFEAGITVDSSIQVQTLAQIRSVNAADQTSFSGTGIINVDQNSLVALEIMALTSSTTVDIEEAGLTIIRIGS